MATTNQQVFGKTFVRRAHTRITEIDGYVSIDASAAVVSTALSNVTGRSGMKEPDAGTSWVDLGTVAKPSGTGIYEVTLNEQYVRLLSVSAELVHNDPTATVDLDVRCGPDNIRTSTAKGSQKLVFVVVKSSDGAPVNPTVACGIRFHARLKN